MDACLASLLEVGSSVTFWHVLEAFVEVIFQPCVLMPDEDSQITQRVYKVCLSYPKQVLVFTCLYYKPSENAIGKGEIARNERFLLSHSVFYPFGELSSIFIEFGIVVF